MYALKDRWLYRVRYFAWDCCFFRGWWKVCAEVSAMDEWMNK